MTEETLCMKTRLQRVALCADIASHYVQDMRVMPASGVARVAWDAMDHIDALEAKPPYQASVLRRIDLLTKDALK